jgi:two-component system, OmpR family, phosphate regulon response regulator PhoB
MSTPTGPRVLIVDDEPVILRLLEVNFRLGGFVVDAVTRGDEALERAAEHPPDVVLVDLMLPEMPGLEIVRRLRARPETAAVPVVMLTARTEREDRERSYALGVQAFVTKPFEPSELLETVRRLVEER